MIEESQQTSIDVLRYGELDVTGRLIEASNGTFYAQAQRNQSTLACVYKPIRGERPLWDFTDGTLAGREVAAYEISQAAGWAIVPPTIMRDGPFGPGMVQQWIDVDDERPVDLVPEGRVPDGWRHVLDAYDERDRPVSLIHEDSARLRRMALFDVVINNADRKGGHLLPEQSGRLYGCDHGVCLHADDKLRTVLWGWAGEPLSGDEIGQLHALRECMIAEELRTLLQTYLTDAEYDVLLARIDELLARGAMPFPNSHWPSIPWPAF